jgi:transposase InsO family protein
MSEKDRKAALHQLWAQLRFAVVGPLLASPPARGKLAAELEELAAKTWRHPTTDEPVTYAFSTVERWYYDARAAADPVGALRRKVRKDRGSQPSMSAKLAAALHQQYQDHRSWSFKLHRDNLAVLVAKDPELGPMPSYSSVRRYMKRHGLRRTQRRGPPGSPGAARAERRLDTREVRSYEAAYVHGLWHTDGHYGSLPVLTARGEWETPLLLAVLDDRARLCCHAQWYLGDETAEKLAHCLSQAFLKRRLPRALMKDGGSAMRAAEIEEGLVRLGILPEPTLEYSPYQNGKQENFWTRVEERLLKMLDGVHPLTLALLNETTQAFLEMEYHREVHGETGEPPLTRFLNGPSVGRPCPAPEVLRQVFTRGVPRSQRQGDGTILVNGVRFEVPSRFRHQSRLYIRYAQWDLSYVLLADRATDQILARLYPVDKTRNADGLRRPLESVVGTGEVDVALPPPRQAPGMAPLLEKYLTEYRQAGLPPAYLPKDDLESATALDPGNDKE